MEAEARLDVLVFVEDPGAARFLASLPADLGTAGRSCRFLAAGVAKEYLRNRGVQFETWPSGAAAGAVLDGSRPRLLVVGTAENPKTPGLALVDAARTRGIRSVGAVDAVANAAHRFRGTSDEALRHAPERLLVPDRWTADAFAALGYPVEAIVVSGHPQYDRVRALRQTVTAAEREALRRRLLPGATGRPVWVFVAEVSTGLDGAQFRRSPEYTLAGRGGTDERTGIVLEELLDAAASMTPRPYLVLRLHPKNTRSEFTAYLSEVDEVSEGGDALELVWAADAVVGMTSMLLLEAAILRRPTLAIVPRELEREWLPSIRAGATPCATTREELAEALAALARGEVPATGGEFLSFGAPERVLRFALEELAEAGLDPRVIETPRLRMVPFADEHLTEKYVAWLNDPNVVRLSNQRFATHTMETCRDFVRGFDGVVNHLWAVVMKDPELGHVGNVTANIQPHHGVADVGVLIGTEARGITLAPEIWVAVRDWLFAVAGMRKVCIGTVATRRGMLRRLTRLGMVMDGVRKDHWLFEDGTTADLAHMSMLRDDWMEWRRKRDERVGVAEFGNGGGES